MGEYTRPNHVKIVYFSGTGGTMRAAERLTAAFRERGVTVQSYQLDVHEPMGGEKADMLILLYPVYAFNAPKPVYDYIRSLPSANNTPAAVISVSGGGEVTPNMACRMHCIRRLEHKGYCVVYEKMLVMPSNIFLPTPDASANRLLQVLPLKVDQTASDLLFGTICRMRPNRLSRFFSAVGELEKPGARWIGRWTRANRDCAGCGLCARSCPCGNIQMKNDRPLFGNQCVLCLRCVYGCPKRAIRPLFGRIIVIKDGYDLSALENRLPEDEPATAGAVETGYAVSGVAEYLKK